MAAEMFGFLLTRNYFYIENNSLKPKTNDPVLIFCRSRIVIQLIHFPSNRTEPSFANQDNPGSKSHMNEITAENEYDAPVYQYNFFILLRNNKLLCSRSKRAKLKMILYEATFHVDIRNYPLELLL